MADRELKAKANCQDTAVFSRNIGTGDPNNEATPRVLDVPFRYPNNLYFDTSFGTLFRWNPDSEAVTNPRWVPLIQLFQGFAGTPIATVYTVYKDGAIAINGARTIYIGTIANDWKGQKQNCAAISPRLKTTH